MWFLIGTKDDLKRVPNGKRLTLTCATCKAKATFYEAEIEKSLQAYVVLKVWSTKRRVMQCGECLAVCDYGDIFPEEVAREEAAKKHLEHEKAEELRKKFDAEQQRLREQAADLQKRAEEAAKKLQAEALVKKAELDKELSDLKKKLGK